MENHFILPRETVDFMAVFKKNAFQIYLVGGGVRDLILNRPVHNWDFATDAGPEKIQALFPDSFYHNDYGTVSVKQPETVFEVTPFRKESDYTDLRHPSKIEWAKTIEEDLGRRDFTLNAIAYDGDKITDPYHGQTDLANKLVKAVGKPDKRFAEDALRLMRAIRIAAELQFMLEEQTRRSIVKNAPLLKNISRERIRDELFKILKSDHPADGVLFLKNTGLLTHVIPELAKTFDVPQKSPKRHHIYDVGTHLTMSLKACRSDNVIVRLATLLHDIGKIETFRKDETTGLITFFNHEMAGARTANKIADDLRLSAKEKDKLHTLVRYHQFTVSEVQTDKAVRRFIREVGKDNLKNMLILRDADRIGSGAKPTSWRYELFKKRLVDVQKQPFAIKDLKIDGNDVMQLLNLNPGPKVGKILQKLFEEVVEKKLPNDRAAQLERLKKLKP